VVCPLLDDSYLVDDEPAQWDPDWLVIFYFDFCVFSRIVWDVFVCQTARASFTAFSSPEVQLAAYSVM